MKHYRAADRFLKEVESGAWSDSPEPWENTADLGLSEVDSDTIFEYAEEAGEDYEAVEAAVLAYVREKVGQVQ